MMEIVRMDNQEQIRKILAKNRLIHLILFLLSIAMIICSSIPGLINKEISFVMRPMSIALSLMVAINYNVRRLR